MDLDHFRNKLLIYINYIYICFLIYVYVYKKYTYTHISPLQTK